MYIQVNSIGQLKAGIPGSSCNHYLPIKALEWTQMSVSLGYFRPNTGAYINSMIQIANRESIFSCKGNAAFPAFQSTDKVRIGSGTTTEPSFLGEITDFQIFVPGALFRQRKKF